MQWTKDEMKILLECSHINSGRFVYYQLYTEDTSLP